MSEPEAAITSRRRPSAVWIVPLVAMLLGVWLVVNAYLHRGPTVQIQFDTAEGLEAGTTPIEVRNVDVGQVTHISLNHDLSGVTVTARLSADAARLIRRDTQFWVVRPRVSSSGISGLGTIVSGAYIEMAPGVGKPARDLHFKGLEHAPPTPTGTPGLRLTLISASSSSLGVGDPVLYRGYTVGRVEDTRLDVESREVRYSIFIDAPYDALVTTSTRFWNASGVSAQFTAQGATVNLASLQSLITGGVSFDRPEDAGPGESVNGNATFELYPGRTSINENPHRYHQDYVLSFSQSVRGLAPGAPVTFRGIPLGSVQRVMVGEGAAEALSGGAQAAIPVLVRLEPARLELGDSPAGVRRLRDAVQRAVKNGLHGTLETGNLLTGSLYVNLDFFQGRGEQPPGEFAGYPTIPTESTGLGRLQQQVSQLVAKLNGLPLDKTVGAANAALEALEATTKRLDALLASDAVRNLPAQLAKSLDQLQSTLTAYSAESGLPDELHKAINELNHTLESVRGLTGTLERKPNALIFPSRRQRDVEPKAGQR